MLQIRKGTEHIPRKYLLSNLVWEDRYDLLMSTSTTVITDSTDLRHYLEENYRCQVVTTTSVNRMSYWREVVSGKEIQFIMCLKELDNRAIALFGTMWFLRIDFFWAGPEVVGDEEEDLFPEDSRYELAGDTSLGHSEGSQVIEDPEDIPDGPGLVLVSKNYFERNWYNLTPLVLRGQYATYIRDAEEQQRQFLTIHDMVDITTRLFRLFYRLTERELVHILKGLPLLRWDQLSPEYHVLFLYGAVDTDTYEALQNYYLRKHVTRSEKFTTTSGEIAVRLTFSVDEVHVVKVKETHLECSCDTSLPEIPCTGIIVLLTRGKFTRLIGERTELQQVLEWLDGLGIITGMINMGLLAFSSGKTKVERKFEGEERVLRLQLTELGRDAARSPLHVMTYVRLRRTVRTMAEERTGITVHSLFKELEQELKDDTLREERIVASSISPRDPDEVRRQMEFTDMLSELLFSHGLFGVAAQIRQLFFRLREKYSTTDGLHSK